MLNLVTGGTGLVGSHLIRHLIQNGEAVRAIKRSSSDTSLTADINKHIEWMDCDLFDMGALEDAFQDVTHVYHSAALVSFERREFELMLKTNVEGTANMVNTALKTGVEKFLQVSSVAAIGRQEADTIVNESYTFTNSKYDTQYGYSKFHAELEVWRAQAEGLNTVIINPSVILGEARWDISSGLIFSNVYNGLKFYSEGINGFIDVLDVVRIAHLLMKSDISGERFILAAENRSFREVFNLIADAFGKPRPSIGLSPALQQIAVVAEWIKAKITGQRALVTRESLRSANMQIRYDHSKVKEALNYEFIPIEKTIERTCQAFLEEMEAAR
jgi:nucleoside-diphosphate-sugar epimerase